MSSILFWDLSYDHLDQLETSLCFHAITSKHKARIFLNLYQYGIHRAREDNIVVCTFFVRRDSVWEIRPSRVRGHSLHKPIDPTIGENLEAKNRTYCLEIIHPNTLYNQRWLF